MRRQAGLEIGARTLRSRWNRRRLDLGRAVDAVLASAPPGDGVL